MSTTPTRDRSPSTTEPQQTAAHRRLVTWLWIFAAVALAAVAVAVGYATGVLGSDEPASQTPADQPPADVPADDVPADDTPVRYDEEPRANWDVTGVAADDVLNVRDAPGVGAPIVATLAHDAAEFESTGRMAFVGEQLWREVIVPGDGVGWVNAAYLTETAPPPSSQPAALALEDGRHAVYLHALDVDDRRLTVDVIQWLSGTEAAQAYQADNPGETGGPPNDYYIVNDNPRLRSLPVSDDVTVRLVRLTEDGDADLDAGTWNELGDYLEDYRTDDGRLSYNPYWITVEGQTIVGIEEQYVP